MRAGCDLMLGLLCVHIDRDRGFLDRLHGAGTGDTAARARHALQQVAVVLAGLRHHHQLAAVAQTLRVRDLDLALGVLLLDDVDDRLRDAARLRKRR